MSSTKGKDLINARDPENIQRVIQFAPTLSTLVLPDWSGFIFNDFHFPKFESDVHYSKTHDIGVAYHGINSERKLGNEYRKEIQNLGSLAIMPSDIEHQFSLRNKEIKFGVISIGPQKLSDFVWKNYQKNTVELLPKFPEPEPDYFVLSIARETQQYLTENSDSKEHIYLEHMQNALLAYLSNKYCTVSHKIKEYQSGLSEEKMKVVTDFINDNLERNLKLEEICKLLNISQYYFIRLFKQSTGLTPHQYIIQQRVKKAQILLIKKEFSLDDIAQECGFSNRSQLSKHFSKVVGVSPSEYRKSLL